MPNDLDYGLKPLNQFDAPAGAPEDWEPDPTQALGNFLMQKWLELAPKAFPPAIAPPPVMSRKEERRRQW